MKNLKKLKKEVDELIQKYGKNLSNEEISKLDNRWGLVWVKTLNLITEDWVIETEEEASDFFDVFARAICYSGDFENIYYHIMKFFYPKSQRKPRPLGRG